MSRHAVRPKPGTRPAQFNTLNSAQILGFTEAIGGVHVTLTPRALPRGFTEERAAAAEAEARAKAAAAAAAAAAAGADKAAAVAAEARHGGVAGAPRAAIGTLPLVSREELATHNGKSSVWFAIDGFVYDLTPWLDGHPGGSAILIRQAGKDASTIFKMIQHSEYAVRESKKYIVGRLEEKAKL